MSPLLSGNRSMERFRNQKILSASKVIVPHPALPLKESKGTCQFYGCKSPATATLPKNKFHESLDACPIHFNSSILLEAYLIEREKIQRYVN